MIQKIWDKKHKKCGQKNSKKKCKNVEKMWRKINEKMRTKLGQKKREKKREIGLGRTTNSGTEKYHLHLCIELHLFIFNTLTKQPIFKQPKINN